MISKYYSDQIYHIGYDQCMVLFPTIKNECQVAEENIVKHIEKLRKQLPTATGKQLEQLEKRIAKLCRTLRKLMKIHMINNDYPEIEENIAKHIARLSKHLPTTTGKELEQLEKRMITLCISLRRLQMGSDARNREYVVRSNIERRA